MRFQNLFRYTEGPIFLFLEQFLGEFKRFFLIALRFYFPLLPLHCVFCPCNDKDPFIYFEQLLLYQFLVIWHFFKSLLKKPLFSSKPLLLFLSSIGCSYNFPFLLVCSFKAIKANCMYNFSERIPFHSDRSLKAVSENEGQLFIKGLPSVVICFWLIYANCILFHIGCIGLTSDPDYCGSSDSGSLPSIYLSLIEIYVVVDLDIPFLSGRFIFP